MMPVEEPEISIEDDGLPPLGEESVYPYHHEEKKLSSWKSLLASLNRFKASIGVAAVVLLLMIATGMGLSKGVSSQPGEYQDVPASNTESTHYVPVIGIDPTDDDLIKFSFDTTEERIGNMFSLIMTAYNSLAIPVDHGLVFENKDSPQYRALQWTGSDKNYHMYDDERRLQRYALAAFFYSTYARPNFYLKIGTPWSSAENWLSDLDECEWEGIICNQDRAAGDDLKDENNENHLVTQIHLAEHRLSGVIPIDLALLRESLIFLILSKNDIYMEGDDLDVFQYLENVKSIHLDDNYIAYDGGLPNSLRGLSNLRKLDLSYNLLQGNIPDEYFSGMKKLTHLEIESNYLSGSLPSSLREKENLIYLYIRRNAFQFDLEELLQNVFWPEIFSIWLDGNNITGPFPTEIGEFTELASLSIANTNITGPIPTEIGKLTQLQRGWFYGNDLTGEIPAELGDLNQLEVMELHDNDFKGEMPQGICDAIANADYKFKELSVDCDKVDCDDCCTSCH